MFDTPHKTAIRRNKLSKPMEYLLTKGLLIGRVLDYGCGHGEDADHIGADKYDPHWFPKKPVGLYDTITCHYVLNVVPEASDILKDIRSLLIPGGKAYVTVRRDLTRDTNTQRIVRLDLPVLVEKKGAFCMFLVS
jgi:hypothetical protein